MPPLVEGSKEANRLRRIQVLQRQKLALKARDDFLSFIKFTMPDPNDPNDPTKSAYHDARHHRAMAKALEQVESGAIQVLVLTVPPRHGKSEQVSRRFPAWYLGRYPKNNVAVATYSDDFAADFGVDVRGIMQSPAYKQVFPGVELSIKDKHLLQTTEGGRALFVGRGGALTGRGAHIGICDDLIKDSSEAESKAVRDKAWHWFTRVLMTRRQGNKSVILTFTRWHKDDVIGRLTDPDNPFYRPGLAKKVKVIELPAIAGDNDPVGRQPGEALWPDGPDKYDLEFLEEQRMLDPLGFEALYQQRPTLADGLLFKRDHMQYYREEELPEDLRIYVASDHAVTAKTNRDATCYVKVGVDSAGVMYILDVFWQRVETDAAVEAMLMFGGEGQYKPLIWWAEKEKISKSIGPFLRRRMLETGRFINIQEVTPSGDKTQRAQSIAARIAMGLVKFPSEKSWTEPAIDELLNFPAGTHDDFVDALSYIGLGLAEQIPANIAKKKAAAPSGGITMGQLMKSAEREDRAKKRISLK